MKRIISIFFLFVLTAIPSLLFIVKRQGYPTTISKFKPTDLVLQNVVKAHHGLVTSSK